MIIIDRREKERENVCVGVFVRQKKAKSIIHPKLVLSETN